MAMKKLSFWENTSINATINIVRTILFALIGIMLVPFYLDKLGIVAYAVIPLATTISSYIMIVADPMAAACSRYTIIAIQKGDEAGVQRDFNTALFGIGRVLIILLPIMALFSFLSPTIFSIDPSMASDVRIMFFLIMISSLVCTASTSFNSIINAYNKLYITYCTRILYILVQVCIIVAMFTFYEPSLIDVGIAYLISSFVLFGLLAFFGKRLHPSIRVSPRMFDRELFMEIGSLGGWNIIATIGTMMLLQASLVMVNMFVGGEAGGGYAMIVSMISMLNTASLSVIAVLSPLAFKYYSEDSLDKMRTTFKTSVKVFGLIFSMPIAFVMVFGDGIITAWVGSEYTYLTDYLEIAFIAELAYVLMNVVSSVPMAFKKVKEYAKIALCVGAFNILLSLMLLNYLESTVTVVVGSWTLSIILFSTATFIFNSRIMGDSWYGLLAQEWKAYAVMIVSYIIMRILDLIIPTPSTWLGLVTLFLPLFVIFSTVIYLTLVRKEERALISCTLPASLKKHLPGVLLGKN